MGRAALCGVESGARRHGGRNPEQWKWSSAAAHCGSTDPNPLLETERWRRRWTVAEWQRFLGDAESAAELSRLRQSTHTGRPLGTADFVAALEELTSRPLAPRKGRASQETFNGPQTKRTHIGRLTFCLGSEKRVNVPSVPRFPVLLGSFKDAISMSQRYELASNLSDSKMDAVVIIQIACGEHNNTVSVGSIYGMAKCFATNNCHVSLDGHTLNVLMCDSISEAVCGKELFKSLSMYSPPRD